MESLKRSRFAAGLDDLQEDERRLESDDSCGTDDNPSPGSRSEISQTKSGKKTRGRVKINMEFIDNKLRRYTTFSKRKSGIMKKAHELATLTGTQVMLLVASETGHVYTFATRKLQPILSSEAGKQLIQTCLNSPDPPTDIVSQSQHDDQRMSAQGFEEPELSYIPPEDTKDGLLQNTYHMLNVMSAQRDRSPPQQRHNTPGPQQASPAESVTLATMSTVAEATKSSPHYSPSSFTLMSPQTVSSHQDQQQFQFGASTAAVRMQMVPVMPDRSSCSSVAPPDVPNSFHSSIGRTTDEGRIGFLNHYHSLQRPVSSCFVGTRQ